MLLIVVRLSALDRLQPHQLRPIIIIVASSDLSPPVLAVLASQARLSQINQLSPQVRVEPPLVWSISKHSSRSA